MRLSEHRGDRERGNSDEILKREDQSPGKGALTALSRQQKALLGAAAYLSLVLITAYDDLNEKNMISKNSRSFFVPIFPPLPNYGCCNTSGHPLVDQNVQVTQQVVASSFSQISRPKELLSPREGILFLTEKMVALLGSVHFSSKNWLLQQIATSCVAVGAILLLS